MPESSVETVERCLVRLPLGAVKKLQTQDYRKSGSYPIVDQGQELIAGWTDDNSGLISQNLPVVVFGDHTRVLKFIDFPFVRGADGTQILKPKPGIDTRYFYYALRAADLPSRGYNRHFKSLKEKEIWIPSGDEQSQISRVLKLVEDSLCVQDKELRTLRRLRLAAMRVLFTCGLRGEAQKETEIGPVPASWQVEPLAAHFHVGSGGTPSRTNPLFWSGGTIPWVKTAEVDYCIIQKTEEYITQNGVIGSSAKILPAGTLLLAMYGQVITRGKVAILGIDAACNQACASIQPKDNAIETKYLYHFFAFRYDGIRNLAHGGQQQNLNLDIVRGLPVASPADTVEQQEIVDTLDSIDRKIDLHIRKRVVLETIFETLLTKLISGQVRVTDLDLSAVTMPAVEAS